MVGTSRRQQMCLTNRAMSQETLVRRFNRETTTFFCNIIALAWKIRLPWLHNMVHWPFWGRQGTKNYFLTHILIQERPLSLLLWKSFWCQGALQLMALMETTSGLLQPSIMLDWSSHNQTVMLTHQDRVEQEPWLHPGGQRGEHSQGCWGETLTLHCNVFSASFQHIYMVLLKVAKLFADSGSVSLCAFVSPYKKDRELARRLHQEVWHLFFKTIFNWLLWKHDFN